MGFKNKKNYKSNNIQGKKGSQFRNQLRGVDLERVLIVAIDAAKYYQKALICNYFGDVFEEPFFFGINEKGISDFCNKIERVREAIKAERIITGVEVTGHYYEDIVRELGKRGYGVTVINAATTFEERASALNYSKTDDLDLNAIAHCLIQNKGMENKLPTGLHQQLMMLTRGRRSEVIKRSKARVEIRTLMDRIWRDFQGYVEVTNNKPKKHLIFSDFWGKSSMYFLEHHPHPEDVLALGEIGIRKVIKELKLRMKDTTIQKLLWVAKQSIVRPKSEISAELTLLKIALQNLKCLNENITLLEKEIEKKLLHSDGRILLSVPGIGVITAAEFYSELGDIRNYDNAGQLIKKAGTNPIIIQSGGTSGYFGRISKQGNKNLRFIVYTIGKSLAQHNMDLKEKYEEFKQRGKHPRKIYIILGNKFIKMAYSMLKNMKPYETKQEDYSYFNEIKKKIHHTKMKEYLNIVLAA